MKIAITSLAALAVALGSAPAMAATGDNGVATYYVSGSAGDYCKLGQATAGGSSGTNASVDTTTANSSGYNGTTSDALIKITALQDGDDHAAAWTANLTLADSVCNTHYRVSAESQNGGLLYTGGQSVDPSSTTAFANNIDYNLKISFGSNATNRNASTFSGSGQQFFQSNATAGNFVLRFQGNADTSKYLLSGAYGDRVVVTMAPHA